MTSTRRGRATSKGRTRSADPRTRLDVEARRAQLLALGLDLFAGRPYDEISIDEFATAAGVSKGLLYHYFSSKHDFYVACVRMAADDLLAGTHQPATLDALERLRLALEGYLDFVEHHGQAYAALFRGGIGSDQEVATIIDTTRSTMLDRLVEGLGTDDITPLKRTVLRGWVGFVEAMSLHWIEHRDVDRAKLVPIMVQALEASLTLTG